MKTAVVILNWNGEKMLRKFLPSVVEFSTGAEVWVADNASTDGSMQLLAEEFPEVKTLVLDKNYGFAEGYNRALQQIEAEYFVLLNSDVEVEDNWLSPLVSFLDKHPEVAAVQPKLRKYPLNPLNQAKRLNPLNPLNQAKRLNPLNPLNQAKRLNPSNPSNPSTLFEYAGACGGFIDKYGYPYCRGRIFGTVEEDKGQYDTPMEIHWATGACMLIRSKDYFEAGGLDGRFFAHNEEIDLCWRLRIMGRKIYCIPQSCVYHVGGGTLPQGNPRKTYLNFRNNLTMLYKNLPEQRLKSVMLIRTVLDYVAALQSLLTGKTGDVKAIFRARRDFHKWKKDFIEDRTSIQNHRILPIEQDLSPIFLLWQYYAKGKREFSSL